MVVLGFCLLALGVFLLMEGVAWWTHRYIMHGWGWGWHRSHHEPHDQAGRQPAADEDQIMRVGVLDHRSGLAGC